MNVPKYLQDMSVTDKHADGYKRCAYRHEH